MTKVNTARLQSLLTYLLLHRHAPLSRLHVASLLWPESSEAQARTNLRHQFHLLRQALPEADLFLRADAHTLQWRSDAPFHLDVADFERATTLASTVTAVQAATELYRGDLLPSCYDEWIVAERERLRQLFLVTLERLIELLEQAHDYAEAIRSAQRLLYYDSFHEATYRRLMRLYALSGDQVGVQRTYRECIAVLQRELAATPSPATRQVYDRLAHLSIPPAQRHNLPVQLTPFIGRTAELASIDRLLADPACRLVTIVGAGGIGKTRLALQAATSQLGAYLHGVYVVPLTSTGSPDLLVSTLAHSLNFAFYGPQDPKAQLINYLREKEMLLVLDNFEHLLAGAALVVDILTSAPDVKLLVTSRERLRLHGEWVYPIQGLAVPETHAIAQLEGYSAAQLFVQSARRVQGDFVLTAADRSAVVRLCQLVGGMPLALELAAAWVQMLSCEEIVRELGQSLGFLTSSLHNLPERHRSMRAVFDHSWNLLAAEESSVFSRLSIFQNGFRREAAERVAGASLPVLAALVDKSLLRRRPDGRYELHELIRQYAAEKLAELPAEQATAQDTHGRYYLEWLCQQQERLISSQQQQAFDEIREDVDNVRLACQWAIIHNRARELRHATTSLRLFYDAQGWFHEADEMIFKQAAEALASNQSTRSGTFIAAESGAQEGGSLDEELERNIALGHVLAQQGWFSVRLGLLKDAQELMQRSLALLRPFGARLELADALQNASMAAWVGGAYTEAQAFLREGLTIYSEHGSRWGIALCQGSLGLVAQSLGNYEEAKQLLQQALTIFKVIGDSRLTAMCLSFLSTAVNMLGNYTEAKQLLQESLTLSRKMDDPWNIVLCLNYLGALIYAGGTAEWLDATHILEESLTICKELGDRWQIGVALNYLGYVTYALTDYQATEQHFLSALQVAAEGHIAPIALNTLVGLATLLYKQPVGKTQSGLSQRKERAVELLALVLDHPASDHEAKSRAQQLWSELEAELAPQVIAAAQARGQARTLDEVVAEILMEHGVV